MADHEHAFPSAESLHDPFAAETRARLRASYEAMGSVPGPHIERTVKAVLEAAHAQERRATRRHGPRWWYGAAAAAVLVAVMMRPWRPHASQRDADSALAAGAASMLPSGSTRQESGGTVRFEFTLPAGARRVALVGDFNGWDDSATPMVRQGRGGSWSALVPLEPGRHEYAFVVDGTRWLVDPLAPQVTDAGFGPTNAVIVDGAAAGATR